MVALPAGVLRARLGDPRRLLQGRPRRERRDHDEQPLHQGGAPGPRRRARDHRLQPRPRPAPRRLRAQLHDEQRGVPSAGSPSCPTARRSPSGAGPARWPTPAIAGRSSSSPGATTAASAAPPSSRRPTAPDATRPRPRTEAGPLGVQGDGAADGPWTGRISRSGRSSRGTSAGSSARRPPGSRGGPPQRGGPPWPAPRRRPAPWRGRAPEPSAASMAASTPARAVRSASMAPDRALRPARSPSDTTNSSTMPRRLRRAARSAATARRSARAAGATNSSTMPRMRSASIWTAMAYCSTRTWKRLSSSAALSTPWSAKSALTASVSSWARASGVRRRFGRPRRPSSTHSCP